jgi:hypothetical protein
LGSRVKNVLAGYNQLWWKISGNASAPKKLFSTKRACDSPNTTNSTNQTICEGTKGTKGIIDPVLVTPFGTRWITQIYEIKGIILIVNGSCKLILL